MVYPGEWDAGWVEPPEIDTETPHLAEVTPSLLAALGLDRFKGTLGLPRVSRACVLLVDGLGWELLERHAVHAPALSALSRMPLRVGYPATTVAGLAAIGTGLPAGEHGMAGYSFEVPGHGVLNALRWRRHPGGPDLRGVLAPETVQPLPTTFARARDAGAEVSVVSHAQFAGSALTRAVLRGGHYSGVHAMGDLAVRAVRALERPGSFCYAYHSDLDSVGHRYGPGSPEWLMQLRHVDLLVSTIVDGLPPDAVLAVVADHGMITVDGTALDFDHERALRDGVRELGGELRARHVYTKDGAAADVLAAWRETLGERAWVVPGEQAIEAGWFGPRVTEQVRPRIGDVVAAARGRSGVLRSKAEPHESALVGQHGSLTSAEQLVPLALAYG